VQNGKNLTNCKQIKTSLQKPLWTTPERTALDKFCLWLIVAGIVLVTAIWFFWSAAVWWAVGLVALAVLMLAGEDIIMRWMFFISVSSGVVWLFFRYVLGVEL
jgi:hypothetical protein